MPGNVLLIEECDLVDLVLLGGKYDLRSRDSDVLRSVYSSLTAFPSGYGFYHSAGIKGTVLQHYLNPSAIASCDQHNGSSLRIARRERIQLLTVITAGLKGGPELVELTEGAHYVIRRIVMGLYVVIDCKKTVHSGSDIRGGIHHNVNGTLLRKDQRSAQFRGEIWG